VVIAGSKHAVAEAIRFIKAGAEFSGAKAIPLDVSAPFHCKLMAPAKTRMAELFAGATRESRPKTPVCPWFPTELDG